MDIEEVQFGSAFVEFAIVKNTLVPDSESGGNHESRIYSAVEVEADRETVVDDSKIGIHIVREYVTPCPQTDIIIPSPRFLNIYLVVHLTQPNLNPLPLLERGFNKCQIGTNRHFEVVENSGRPQTARDFHTRWKIPNGAEPSAPD